MRSVTGLLGCLVDLATPRFMLMLGNLTKCFATIAAVLAFLPAAEAAVLTANGNVMINRGNGFEIVNGATEANPGDTVLVNEGTAQTMYPDGTVAMLEPGQPFVVPEAPPAPPPGTEAPAGSSTAGGLSTTTLVVGGLVAAGGLGLAISASKPSEKKPSSP